MAVRSLTDKFVQSVRPGKADRFEWDSHQRGLGLKITPRGRKFWVLQGVFPTSKNPTRSTIAAFADLTLKEARARAKQWRVWLDQGLDPRQEEKLASAGDRSFTGMAEGYIADHLAGLASGRVVARDIRTHLLPVLGAREASKITRRDIVHLVTAIKARGKKHMARQCLGQLRQIFEWGLDRDYGLQFNPAAVKPKSLVGVLPPRDRYLSDLELQSFWRASSRMSYPYQQFFRLLMLTGSRRSTIAKMRWRYLHPQLLKIIRENKPEKINWSAVPAGIKVMTIPSSRTEHRHKSGFTLIKPLSDDVCAILASTPRFARGDYVLTTTAGEKPINGFTKPADVLRAKMERGLRAYARKFDIEVDVEPFRPHDFKRTVRTNLAALGYQEHVCDLAVEHSRKGIQRIYDQHRYATEVGQALAGWAMKLRTIVSSPMPPDNIIKLVA